MNEQRKDILMVHLDREQGKLWQTALGTQQLGILNENTPLDIVQYLDTLKERDRQSLPNLLLMDMSIKSPNSETLQSTSVCQWVNKQKIPIKIVLLNPRQDRIKDIEHSWALRRGAADVLPRLSRENLITEIAKVTALIGCYLSMQPLENLVSEMGRNDDSNLAISKAVTKIITKPPINPVEDKLPANLIDNNNNNLKNTLMYRGVRVRR